MDDRQLRGHEEAAVLVEQARRWPGSRPSRSTGAGGSAAAPGRPPGDRTRSSHRRGRRRGSPRPAPDRGWRVCPLPEADEQTAGAHRELHV